ncbi:MAG: GNAT family N-acetyltransferase [Treponema sp.]|nr:GNAT family N-acetyltransferase [Treponema sp.]
MARITFRSAGPGDIPLILRFIRDLARYEKLEHEVVATEELLCQWLFEKNAAEVIFAVVDGTEAGFALFFSTYSTFLGRAGMFLEDLFVSPEYRRTGIGKALFCELARLSVERGYGRLEWRCLDWNTPSIDFYLSLGAKPKSEWTEYRIAGGALSKLAGMARENATNSKSS